MKKSRPEKSLHAPNLIFVFPPLSVGLIKRYYLTFQTTALFISLTHHDFSNFHIMSSPLERETLLMLLPIASVLRQYYYLYVTLATKTTNVSNFRENHRITEVGRDLSVSPGPTPPHSRANFKVRCNFKVRSGCSGSYSAESGLSPRMETPQQLMF